MKKEQIVFTIEYTDFGVKNTNSNGDTRRVKVVASSYEWAIQLFRLQLPKSLNYSINSIYSSDSKLVAIESGAK